MERRSFLGATASALATGIAGCLDQFETRSVWEQPPLVEDRPEAVYTPSSVESMRIVASRQVDDLAVGLFYTFPHRFWTVTGERRNRVGIDEDDVMHLMATVWDPETGLVPPAEIALELSRDGDLVESVQLWPMLSQRMGFHYGDNVALPDSGSYEVDLRMAPPSVETTGAVAGLFAEPVSTTIELPFDPGDVYDIDFAFVEQQRWGTPGAVPLMIDRPDPEAAAADAGTAGERDWTVGEHDEHDGSDHAGGDPGHPLPFRAPAPEDLPGTVFEAGTTGDAVIVATVLDSSPAEDESGPYLAVSPRTPYNRVGLPLMTLSATVGTGSDGAGSTPLTQRLDGRLGHHYGAPLDVGPGDELTITVDAPPQVARHDGYETAFFGMDDLTVTVPA